MSTNVVENVILYCVICEAKKPEPRAPWIKKENWESGVGERFAASDADYRASHCPLHAPTAQ